MKKLTDIDKNIEIKIKEFKFVNDGILKLMEFGLLIDKEITIINRLFKNIIIRLNGSYYSIPYELAKLIYVIEI